MRCGESVLALVALWCADKRLLFSLLCPVIALSIVMTSHVGSSEKIVRTVSHAYVVHLLNLVAERGVPGFVKPDQWKGFPSAMVTAHEADI